MHTFSTVLFVNGNPVGYTVSKNEDRLLLNPAENPNRDIHPPCMSALNQQGFWLVEGTNDRDLIAQVIEDVSIYEDKFPHNELSVAP
jgi:hypothetical protein